MAAEWSGGGGEEWNRGMWCAAASGGGAAECSGQAVWRTGEGTERRPLCGAAGLCCPESGLGEDPRLHGRK